jgi:hypothetical protein
MMMRLRPSLGFMRDATPLRSELMVFDVAGVTTLGGGCASNCRQRRNTRKRVLAIPPSCSVYDWTDALRVGLVAAALWKT